MSISVKTVNIGNMIIKVFDSNIRYSIHANSYVTMTMVYSRKYVRDYIILYLTNIYKKMIIVIINLV